MDRTRYGTTREKTLERDLARARDALAMAYSGLDRARVRDPWFDIDARMALVREDMDYLDGEHGAARRGAPADPQVVAALTRAGPANDDTDPPDTAA